MTIRTNYILEVLEACIVEHDTNSQRCIICKKVWVFERDITEVHVPQHWGKCPVPAAHEQAAAMVDASTPYDVEWARGVLPRTGNPRWWKTDHTWYKHGRKMASVTTSGLAVPHDPSLTLSQRNAIETIEHAMLTDEALRAEYIA